MATLDAVIMGWFDRDHASGGLSDDEWSLRQSSFAQHLEEIRSRLSDGADQLLASVHLHDGQVASWTYERGACIRDASVCRRPPAGLRVDHSHLRQCDVDRHERSRPTTVDHQSASPADRRFAK